MIISGKAKIMEVGYKITHVTCNLLLSDGSLYHPANSNALVVERDHSLLNPSMTASAWQDETWLSFLDHCGSEILSSMARALEATVDDIGPQHVL